jgi:hypothetical protein
MRTDRAERRIRRYLAPLPVGTRRALLHILAAAPDKRAERIRQLYGYRDTRELAEVLMDLEVEPRLRLDVMEALKESIRR